MAYRLTRTAEDQIDAILLESARQHGLDAAGRYGELILIALATLGAETRPIEAVEIPRLRGILAYPLRLLRQRTEAKRRVGNPPHLIVYRAGADGTTEVLGIVHDRMVLSRAARRVLRTNEGS